jgi:hypothetical protein
MSFFDAEERMTKLFALAGAFAIAAALQLGPVGVAWAQDDSDNANDSGAVADVGQASPAGAPQAYQTPPAAPVLFITSVEVLQTSLEPKQAIIKVRGLTGSRGWSGPQLVPLFQGVTPDGILDLQFIAQTPDQTQKAEGFMPIYAIFPLGPGDKLPKGIRVRGVGNVMLLTQLPGSIETTIDKEDGSKAVGKTWAEKGTAQPGAANVVREEDMPRNFRIIPPKKGVAGITHNMNRLNLVLGEDGKTITWAFWE